MAGGNEEFSDKSKSLEDTLSQFDEGRIIRREVSTHERATLKEKLVKMFAEKAAREEKEVVGITDEKEYAALNKSGEFFSGRKYYLFVDKQGNADMRHIVYHLLDTEEGRFYGKLIVYDEDHPNAKQE